MRSDKAFLYFKLSFIGSLVSLFGTFLLCYTLFRYSPELHVISQFYTKGIQESNQQNETVPFEVKGTTQTLIDEMLIRYYIETRYTAFPDDREMLRRWRGSSPFASLSTRPIYDQFVGKGIEDKIKKLKNTVSTVDILAIRPHSKVNGQYDVDFDIYTRTPEGQIGRQQKRATLRLGHGKPRNKKEFANPYGTVIGYFSEKTRND